ncbi:MAG: LapA family protein [Burkholderiales bacterium]
MDSPFLTRLAQIAGWLVKGLLFLLLLGLAIKNSDPVTVRYYLGLEWQAPLALALFVFFVLGALMGLLAMLAPWVRQRSEIRRLRASLAQGPAQDAADA